MQGDVNVGRRVRFVTKRWSHHSTHSGYDRIVDYMGSAVPAIDMERLTSRWIPDRVASRFARQSGVVHYFDSSFYAEWAAAREMLVRPRKTVYHILYGDDTYRYLGSLRRWRGHRLVVSYHVPPDDLRDRLRHTRHLTQADALVVVARNQLSFFAEICGEERVRYIPHGIDTDVFCPDPVRDTWEGREPQVLFVGSHRRDIVTLGEVISRMERLAPEVKFVLLMDPSVGDTLRGHANVEVRSNVSEPELIRLFRTSSLLVQTLQESTANNAILEAMACGTPVVATDIGGVQDYVTEECSILTAPHDTGAMVDAIMDIVRDPPTRRAMGEAARRRALEFQWPNIASRLAELYRAIL